MTLVSGMHHVATVTADLDRLERFYADVFGAPTTARIDDEVGRHSFIAIGSRTVLHAFETGHAPSPEPGTMFERGRLDHIALEATDRTAFDELRDRLRHVGASPSPIVDRGDVLSTRFVDPDGMDVELCCRRPDRTTGLG